MGQYYSVQDGHDPFAVPPTPVLNAEERQHVKDWIEALESDKHPQTKHCLRVGDAEDERNRCDPVGFCCLGVACHVFDPTKWADEGDFEGKMAYPSDSKEDEGMEESSLPGQVARWLGLGNEIDPMLRGVAKRPCTVHYLPPGKADNYLNRVKYEVREGNPITMPASWWNDSQDYTFREIAQLVRTRFGITEDQP